MASFPETEEGRIAAIVRGAEGAKVVAAALRLGSGFASRDLALASDVKPVTVQKEVRHLKEAGLLVEEVVEAAPARGPGRPPRRWRVPEDGRAALEAALAASGWEPPRPVLGEIAALGDVETALGRFRDAPAWDLGRRCVYLDLAWRYFGDVERTAERASRGGMSLAPRLEERRIGLKAAMGEQKRFYDDALGRFEASVEAITERILASETAAGIADAIDWSVGSSRTSYHSSEVITAMLIAKSHHGWEADAVQFWLADDRRRSAPFPDRTCDTVEMIQRLARVHGGRWAERAERCVDGLEHCGPLLSDEGFIDTLEARVAVEAARPSATWAWARAILARHRPGQAARGRRAQAGRSAPWLQLPDLFGDPEYAAGFAA